MEPTQTTEGGGPSTPGSTELAPPEEAFPCQNLRSKAMYYQAEDDDGIFWCAQTQENMGPDGAPTGKTECCNRRACYVG